MANFKKQKKMNKTKNNYRNNSTKSNINSKYRSQRGGVSNSCTLNASTNGGTLMYNYNSNLHNTNPQANLDNMTWGGYGSPVPLGSNILQGGSNKCGDEGIGTSNTKNSTFKQYLNNVNQKLNLNMNGGGFTTDPSEYIAGLPVYKSYDDCCPPVIVNDKLMFGSPGKPVCGHGAVSGGARKNTKTQKKQFQRKQNKKSNYKKKKQQGGDWNSVGRSKPAMYSNAFNGPKGVFAYPEDMSKRTFDETQPNYSVNAI